MKVKIFRESSSVHNEERVEKTMNEWLSERDITIEFVTTNSNKNGFWIILFYTEDESEIDELLK